MEQTEQIVELEQEIILLKEQLAIKNIPLAEICEDFLHEFGNSFTIAKLVTERLCEDDPNDTNLAKIRNALSRMEIQYHKTFNRVHLQN